MPYRIEWIETKSPEWKVATVNIGQGKTVDASINKTSKKGEAFPDFDNLKPGMEVEAELWQSPAGKWYLFPPKPQTINGGANRGSGAYKQKLVEETMARKESSIREFQGNKEESIRMAGAQRDAVLIVINLYKEIADDLIMTPSEKDAVIKKKIVEWRDYFLSGAFNETVPF